MKKKKNIYNVFILIGIILVILLLLFVIFLIKGHNKKTKRDIIVNCGYENTFSKENENYKAVYNDDWILNGKSKEFSKELLKISLGLSISAYYKEDIINALEQMSFRDINDFGSYERELSIEDNDYVSYNIAVKKIDNKIIYLIPIRGTGENSEWFSNFNLGEDGNHKGFYEAKSELLENLENLFKNDGYSVNNRIIWTMGHSRGAAISNIIAGELSTNEEYALMENIYCYTFACPSVSKNIVNSQRNFTNIYNYNYSADIVPILPLEEWGYTRYGITVTSQSDNKCIENVKNNFEKLTNEKYTALENYEMYMEVMNSLIESEEMYNSDLSKITFTVLAYKLGGERENSFREMMSYLSKKQSGKIAAVLARMTLNKITGKNESFREILEEVYLDNDEFYNNISENREKILGNLEEMLDDVDGNISEAIVEGHCVEMYESWIEALYG